jgi:hypothetical protein
MDGELSGQVVGEPWQAHCQVPVESHVHVSLGATPGHTLTLPQVQLPLIQVLALPSEHVVGEPWHSHFQSALLMSHAQESLGAGKGQKLHGGG